MIALPAETTGGLDYGFAVSAREVTIDDYERFSQDLYIDETTAPSNDCPMHNVSWHEALRYCNWLSEQDGIPESEWVFEITPERMRIKDNYKSLSGYRLPTHEEWKYFCLAGSFQEYSFGVPNELAGDYIWFLGSSLGHSHPVGSKLPNDFGIFDVHGNSWEWSLDARTFEGTSYELLDVNSQQRGLYGGAFNSVLRNVQINSNTSSVPDGRSNYYGFRVVRGLP